MKVIHIGIMRIKIFVSSTSVTLQSFHLFCSCCSGVWVGIIMAALSRHLHKKIMFKKTF